MLNISTNDYSLKILKLGAFLNVGNFNNNNNKFKLI